MWTAFGVYVRTDKGNLIPCGDEATATLIAAAVNNMEQHDRMISAAVAILARHSLIGAYGEELAKKRGDRDEGNHDGQAATGGGSAAQLEHDAGVGTDGRGDSATGG